MNIEVQIRDLIDQNVDFYHHTIYKLLVKTFLNFYVSKYSKNMLYIRKLECNFIEKKNKKKFRKKKKLSILLFLPNL